MTTPLIGITTSELRKPASVSTRAHDRRDLALGLAYAGSVGAGGGAPMVIPPFTPEPQLTSILDRLDGLVLSGGPDIEPVLYGGERDGSLGPTDIELDRFELAVAQGALDRGLPVLAICRGAELLNVLRGGTLLRNVDGHRQTDPGGRPAHDVAVEPGSALARILGCTTCAVNSFHHQAADAVGDGLRVVARAPDGVIEAVEDPSREMVVGVQWHAESMVDSPEQRALFAALARAAADRAASLVAE